MVTVAGEDWPDGIMLMTEEEWEASPRDVQHFVVWEWVLGPAPVEGKQPKRRRTGIRRLLHWAALPALAARVSELPREAGHAYLLADALYEQLEARELVLCDVFERAEFRQAVEDEYWGGFGASRTALTVFALVWLLLVVVPLVLGVIFCALVLACVLRGILVVAPRWRSARLRYALVRRFPRRIVRPWKKLWGFIQEARKNASGAAS